MSLDVELIAHADTGGESLHAVCLFEANITHNLGPMAGAAGIYDCLWRAPENFYFFAEQLIEPLTEGLKRLESDPDYYREFDSPNGWGTYADFVPWVRDLLEKCKEHPKASFKTCR